MRRVAKGEPPATMTDQQLETARRVSELLSSGVALKDLFITKEGSLTN